MTRRGSNGQFVRELIERLFFLGIAGYALAFFGRNYRVARHVQVTNEQKQVALDTYPLLIDAILDDPSDPASTSGDARNIITAEAARATFDATDSGFLGEERERTIIENQPSLLGALTALRR